MGPRRFDRRVVEERGAGIVEIKLHKEKGGDGSDILTRWRWNSYLDSRGDFFCCAEGIYHETWDGASGVENDEITFVISRLKPIDGICKPIYRSRLLYISRGITSAYRAAAGHRLPSAWYWIEH